METLDDAELLRRVHEGDRNAWAQIVDRYERLVWSVVRGFRFDDATSADVAQTVWLRFGENVRRLQKPDRLGSWLAAVARNECISITRRRTRETTDDAAVERQMIDLTGDIDEDLLDRETVRSMLDAFGSLSDSCQELLRLLCTDPPLDYQSVSDLTGRPIGSIGPTRQRCLDKLRSGMGQADHV